MKLRLRSSAPFFRRILLAYAVGAGMRCAVAMLAPTPAWDGVIYERAARQLAAGEGYTLRILSETAPADPTAFYPVGYPGFLAGLQLCGVEGRPLLLVQALIAALAIVGAGLLGRRLAGSRAGVIAAWLMALHPGSIMLGGAYLSEPVFTAGLTLALCALAYARKRRDVLVLFASSAMLGGLSLMRPLAILVAPFTGMAMGYRELGRLLLYAALAPCFAILVASPWILRNEHELGRPGLSTNGGFNLLLGTIGIGAYGDVPPEIDCPRRLGEVDKDRCRRERAVERMIARPDLVVGRGALKLANTMGHESTPARYLAASLGAPEHPLAWVGVAVATAYWWALLLLAYRARKGWAPGRIRTLLFAPVVATVIVHAMVIGGDRYHLPLVPVLCALAASGLRKR